MAFTDSEIEAKMAQAMKGSIEISLDDLDGIVSDLIDNFSSLQDRISVALRMEQSPDEALVSQPESASQVAARIRSNTSRLVMLSNRITETRNRVDL